MHLEMAECRVPFWVTDFILKPLTRLKNPEYGHVAYQIKRNEMFDNIQEKHFLSLNGHVAYQIKENDSYSHMQAIILSLNAPSTPRVGYYFR